MGDNMSKIKHITCDICSKKKAIASNYYKSNREEYKVYDGYCPVCKPCLRSLSIDDNLGKITPNKFKTVLKYLDSPYIDSIFVSVAANEDTTNTNFIGKYRSALNLNPDYKGSSYSDSVRFEILNQERQNAKSEGSAISSFEISDEMRLFWGTGLEDDAYFFLQTMFNKFTKNEHKMDYKKESDYKTLCIYEWQKSTIQYDIGEVANLVRLQKMIDDLSTSLGIQARQRQEEESNEKFTIGLIARYSEDIKRDPIGRWVEDLGNVDLMRNLLEVHFKGGLMHSLQIPNPDIERYQRELNDYTVHITPQDKEDNEDGDD